METNRDKLEKVMNKISSGREYRKMLQIEIRAAGDQEESYLVEGYATVFDQAYTLYNWGDYIVNEQISSKAFDECDMSDTIMQYDHAGRVFARVSNNTLTLEVDSKGLKVTADLGGTEEGRKLYEEIKGGYTTKMSFGFTVGADERTVSEDYEKNITTVLRTITKITKLYDVSAVSLPANDATEISARSFCDGVIEKLKAERLEQRARADRLKAECLAMLSL